MPYRSLTRAALLAAALTLPTLAGCGGGGTTEIPAKTPPPPANDPGPGTAGPPVKAIPANR